MQTGSMFNLLMGNSTSPVPEVGMGATILHWTDRTACTIVEATERKVVVQADIATRVDKNGMSDCQTYEYTRNPEGKLTTFTKRKNGAWVQQGSGFKSGTRLSIGNRSEYYDYSF